MKVLWFAPTPSLSSELINVKNIAGGWISSLEFELARKPDIQLGIVFKCNDNILPFTLGSTSYFPIPIKAVENRLISTIKRLKHYFDDNEYLQSYLDIIQAFKPDIIQLFGTEFDYGLIIPKITIPCVIHFQGNLIVYHHKWYSGLTAFEIIKYSKKWNLLNGYGHFHDYFFFKKAAEREYKIFKECKHFMGRTDWDRRITSVLAPDSVYYHCDEIMRPEFYLHKWLTHQKRNDFFILSTSRNCTYKGLETIFECQRILKQSFNKLKVTWKIAGVNENDEISYLIERKYNDLFKNYNIQLLGKIEEKELIELMLEADLFVHPSHIDNSPNTVCEAMLLGMPIIATYAGGIPNLIENNVEGLLVQDGDPYALAGTILEIIKDRNKAVRLGTNAKDKAVIKHNPEAIANNVVSIYESMLSNI